MQANKHLAPSLVQRLASVWYRHMRVYTRSLFSNGLPPFLEPIIFLAGVGLGVGRYIESMDGIPYLTFLATALPITSSMFTAAYECTFGTFIRLEFEKAYDGMLAAPVTVHSLFIGEILWAGTKGAFFSACVVAVMACFGVTPIPASLVVPCVGFATGCMFGALSLLVTSFVRNINHFNFYFTGFLSPMFFFSGAVFPLSTLPAALRPFAEVFPLTHSVRLARALALSQTEPQHWLDVLYLLAVTLVAGYLGIGRLKRRIVL